MKCNAEVYRSGHNGPDSKSGRVKALVGSNPTASAMQETVPETGLFFAWLGRWDIRALFARRMGSAEGRGVLARRHPTASATKQP